MVGSNVSVVLKNDVELVGIVDSAQGHHGVHPPKIDLALVTETGSQSRPPAEGGEQKDDDGNTLPAHLAPVRDHMTLATRDMRELYCPGINLISETNRGNMASAPVEERDLMEASDWLSSAEAAKAEGLTRAAGERDCVALHCADTVTCV